MKIYLVYINNRSEPIVKCTDKELIVAYLAERNLIHNVTNAIKLKVNSYERYDDNYLIEYFEHPMTNKEVRYIEYMLEELDYYSNNLKDLKNSLKKKDKKKVNSLIKNLNEGKIRKEYSLYYIHKVIENPIIVDEYIYDIEMFRMRMMEVD